MTDESSKTGPTATPARRPWSGLILAIPLAALIVVTYLGIQTLAHRGTVVTVTFDRAADVRPGDTKVLYEGAQAGELVKITPNKDGHRVDYQLRMVPEVQLKSLSSTAQFWLIGAAPTLANLDSLKAAVAGIAIGYEPGEGGQETRHFEGLDKEPVVRPRDRGRYVTLITRELGTIAERSAVLLHGQSVGKVADVAVIDERSFRVRAFIFSPYDSFVKPNTLFWRASPLRMSMSGGTFRAELASSSTLLAGGIEMDVPAEVSDRQQSAVPANEFVLYASESSARQGLSGPSMRYDFVFTFDTGGLPRNTPINLMSFQIGEVENSRLVLDAVTKRPRTIVTGLIYPRNLLTGSDSNSSPEVQRSAADEALRDLVSQGYRVKIMQIPPMVGSPVLSLAPTPSMPKQAITYAGAIPVIPTLSAGTGMDDIMAQASQILSKVNRVPIAPIGGDLQAIMAKIKTFVASPGTQQALEHLKDASARLDALIAELQPKIGTLVNGLSHASAQLSGQEGGGPAVADMLQQLTEAAQSLKTLTDFLERHPESLIRGKAVSK